MNWKQLETFYVVAQTKRLSIAAREMNLSQGAISRQIALLEESTNVKLFHRHPKGLVLTPSGEIVFDHVRKMYAEAAMVVAQLNDTRDHPSGVLKVSAPVALGTFWLMPRIARFNALYPDLAIELSLTDAEVDLSTGMSNVALRFPVVERPGLVRRRLGTIGFYAFASRDYLAAAGTPAGPEDLNGHRLIAFRGDRPEDYERYNWTLRIGAATRRVPALQINNVYACYVAVRNGMGIGVIPEYFAWETEDFVRVLPECGTSYQRELSLYYPVELKGLARLDVFRDFICDELAASTNSNR